MVLSPFFVLSDRSAGSMHIQGGALALAALAFFKAHELYPPKP